MQQPQLNQDQNYYQQEIRSNQFQKGVKPTQSHKLLQESSENSFQKYMKMVNKDMNKTEENFKK